MDLEVSVNFLFVTLYVYSNRLFDKNDFFLVTTRRTRFGLTVGQLIILIRSRVTLHF